MSEIWSARFVCHLLFKCHSWHRTEICDTVWASCYVETWSANAICQGIFRSFWLGYNSIQIICCVYLYGVHVQRAVMCVPPIQNWCHKTKESKILLCCLTWHSHVFKNSQRHEACCSSDWYGMKLLYVPVAICVHLFICRLWGTFHWDPLEMLLKLRHIKLQTLKLWSCIGAN